MMWRGPNTWVDKPEYRHLNDGWGGCNLSAPGARRKWCVFRGIGCDVDHVAIRQGNDRRRGIR